MLKLRLFEHPLKAPSPMLIIPSGISIVVRLLQFAKALSAIYLTGSEFYVFGMVISVTVVLPHATLYAPPLSQSEKSKSLLESIFIPFNATVGRYLNVFPCMLTPCQIKRLMFAFTLGDYHRLLQKVELQAVSLFLNSKPSDPQSDTLSN